MASHSQVDTYNSRPPKRPRYFNHTDSDESSFQQGRQLMSFPSAKLNQRVVGMPLHGSEVEQGKANLIVNYLPQTLSDAELHEIFIPYGEIESVRIVRDKQSGYSFGYGFVKYLDPASAAMAISVLNGLQILNKYIKVSYARPPSVEIKDTNLYITNLPRSTTEDELTQMFAPFGDIVQRHILYDKYTQLPKGVAFVRYDRREQANAAIEAMNNFLPMGANEPLRVRLAENHGRLKASFAQGFQAGFQKRF